MSFARQFTHTISVAAMAVAFTAGAARAPRHTTLVKSEPAAKSTVAQAPKELVLWFSEKVDLKVSRFKLSGGRAGDVALGSPKLDDSRQGIPVVVPVKGSVSSGVYTVEWTVASDDGHPVKNTFTFTVK